MRDLLIISKNLFIDGDFYPGSVLIHDNKIQCVSKSTEVQVEDQNVEILDVDKKIVMPALIDVHAFFSGYALHRVGCDLSEVKDQNQLIDFLRESGQQDVVFGQNMPEKLNFEWTEIEKSFPQGTAFVLWNWDLEFVRLNTAATEKFGFSGDELSSESQWRIIQYVLNLKPWIIELTKEYMQLLNSKGVATTKEMLFDDGYGLADILLSLHDKGQSTLRTHLMSQPVGFELSIETAEKLAAKAHNDFVMFDGFNRMTDGSVSVQEADLKKPYEDGHDCQIQIDYEKIREDVLKADAAGFRHSLHAQGDAAVRKSLDIFAECQKDDTGKLKLRHAITDLELTDPHDLPYMEELGVIAEVYPQIMAIYDDAKEKIDLTYERVGDRADNYWNRKGMIEAGITVSCGTDLPLVIDDIGQGVFHSCYGQFSDGTKFQEQNCWGINDLFNAWTYGGAQNLGLKGKIGELKEGQLADLIVLNMCPHDISRENAKDLAVVLTLVNGEVVYRREA